MASSDDSYTATGDTIVAFETKFPAAIEIGVGVVGTKCGVYGQSRAYTDLYNTNTRDTLEDDVGVHGRGAEFGVIGRGTTGVGVYGEVGAGINDITPPPTDGNSTGVLGQGYQDSYGVVGLCFGGKKVTDLNFGSGTGVLGVSNANSDRSSSDPRLGAGVVGLSVTSSARGFEGGNPVPSVADVSTFGNGTGVWGVSRGGKGVHGESLGGRGVHGQSSGEAGVFGESASGRGGVFESRQQAQLQLMPKDVVAGPQRPTADTPVPSPFPILPKEGMAGDLMATKDEVGQVRLWFCVRSQVADRPAGWAPVLLGPTFDAE
jgi:hypothetical protein